jgi:hypothetical protein
MKKFSKLITETKQELWTKHPLVNPVDWDEIFKPLIEHIDSNLKANVPPPGEGIFGSKTNAALDELIDAITEDYVEYYTNVVDDGSQESFFSAYNISVDWNNLMDCVQPLMDRTDDVEDYPQWDGGYFYMSFTNLEFNNIDELIEDILDIFGKLKMFKVDYKISLHSKSISTHLSSRQTSAFNQIKEEQIEKMIKSLLELPGQKPELWVKGLKQIEIFIYNKDTVQVGDLD